MAEPVQSQNPRERKITQEFLRGVLHYDPETGVFRWKGRADRSSRWNSKYAGKIAGWINRRGAVLICLTDDDDGFEKRFCAHRLAFIYMGEPCPAVVDHKDGNPSNNRWENLREATISQNGQNRSAQSNNKSGFKGVTWKEKIRKWNACIQVDGRQKHLGVFASAEEAYAAYCAAAVKYHGEFARF